MDLSTIFDSALAALEGDRTAGVGTAVTHTVVRSGVTCDVQDGAWKLVADEMPGDGGAGLGPDPGVFGRAALGSCLAMGYVMWAAHLRLKLDHVAVTVEADYDAHGMFGINDAVSPGWTGLRYSVEITTGEAEDRVLAMIETADRYSSILDCFRRPLDIQRAIAIRTE